MHTKVLSKWYNSGVGSALFFHKSIDFTVFFETFQDTAVANHEHFYFSLHIPDFAIFIQ